MNKWVMESENAGQSLEGELVDPEGPALQEDRMRAYPYAVRAVLVKML